MTGDRLYLTHILECVDRILDYTAGGYAKFRNDIMLQDAVIRNLEIIGEATKHLSAHVRDQHPDIPWRRIAGMRDVLIHDYMGVDIDEVWNVVEFHLGDLREAVQAALAKVEE